MPVTVGDSYWQIIRRNGLNIINILLFLIAAGLIALGQYRDALFTGGLVALNVVIGTYQEVKAKKQVQRIALLNRPDATVIRDGQRQAVDPTGIVLGDLVVVQAGDQIPVDGKLMTDTVITMDEANLTGEADSVQKRQGDELFSASICLSGSGIIQTLRVGDNSAAQKVTSQARSYRSIKTPLQQEIDIILRIMAIVVALLALGIFTLFENLEIPVVEGAQASAVLVALIPQGLVMMVAVSYSLAVLRLSPKGIMIQRINAVESLSHIDILCVDKTGTLTTQQLQVDQVVPLGDLTEGTVRGWIGDYIASTPAGNKTSEAIGKACPGTAREIHEEVPFASIRKWSALSFPDTNGTDGGAFVLGAPEMILPAIKDADPGVALQVEGYANQGLRVLLFARAPGLPGLYDGDQPQLPAGLEPAAVIVISDELRPGVQDTIRDFTAIGIELKVISGDNAETVLALAKQAGLPETAMAVSGSDLDGISDEALEDIAEQNAVFGRVTPEHKERLVNALARRGHWVAMTGDGVNDILALKQAKVGIAMRSGSEATQGVADLVLLDDSFEVLPPAFAEGQRVMRGMSDNIKLFLTRTLALYFAIFAIAVIGADFPITPGQNTILAMLTVGIPAFALAYWAKPGHTPRGLRRMVIEFILPASILVAIISVAIYDTFLTLTGGNVAWAQAALTTTMVFTLLLIVLFAQPPSPAWVGGSSLNGDLRPAFLVAVMYLVYFIIVLVPFFRNFFDLKTLPWSGYIILAFVVAGWAVMVRYLWRTALSQRAWGYTEHSVGRLRHRVEETGITELVRDQAYAEPGEVEPGSREDREQPHSDRRGGTGTVKGERHAGN